MGGVGLEMLVLRRCGTLVKEPGRREGVASSWTQNER
jgi:hypothetical protein